MAPWVTHRRSLDEILAHHTGQEVAKVAKDTDRDFILGAAEAKEYGLVDEVLLLNPRKQKKD